MAKIYPHPSPRVGIWMAVDRVRGAYPQFSGLRVSGLSSDVRPWICGFGYPKIFGSRADSKSNTRSSIGPLKQSAQ